MKKWNILVAVIAVTLIAGQSQAQTIVASKTSETVTPSQVLAYAKEAKQLMGSRTYEPITIRKRIDKSSPLYKMLPYFDKGNEVINKVLRKGSGLTQADAIKYDQEMQQSIDGLKALATTTQVADIPSCFKGCDTNYPGIGGGNGWKRFTCKTACLIAEVAD